MLYLVIKAAISGVIVALVSEIARRYPGWGGLVASLPLTSLLAMVWLWRDTSDPAQVRSACRAVPSGSSCHRCRCSSRLPMLLRSGARFLAEHGDRASPALWRFTP